MKYLLTFIFRVIAIISLIFYSIALMLWHWELNPVSSKASGYFNGRRLFDEWTGKESAIKLG